MGQLAEDEARKLLKDPRLADEILKRISKEPAVLAHIADEIADALKDVIEEDDGLRRKILASISRNKAFRQRFTQEVSKNIQ